MFQERHGFFVCLLSLRGSSRVSEGLRAGICQMSVDPTEVSSHAITLHVGRRMFFVFSDLCLPDVSD